MLYLMPSAALLLCIPGPQLYQPYASVSLPSACSGGHCPHNWSRLQNSGQHRRLALGPLEFSNPGAARLPSCRGLSGNEFFSRPPTARCEPQLTGKTQMRSLPVAASPQEQVYAQAYKDLTAHLSADEAFGRTRSAVESHLGLLGKQAQVRVRNWLKKLSEEVSAPGWLAGCRELAPPPPLPEPPLNRRRTATVLQTANVVWKRNRNAYARLLLEQLRCGKLEEPFSAQPPGGPLPTLPKHLGYAFQPPRGGTGGAGTGGSPAAAGPQAGPPVAPVQSLQQQQALQHQALQQPHRQQQQVQALSASEQLDEYLGRADFRRAQHVEEEESAAAAAAAWVPNAAPLHTSSAAGGGAGPAPPLCLPGTRMQLRGAEGRRVDRCVQLYGGICQEGA